MPTTTLLTGLFLLLHFPVWTWCSGLFELQVLGLSNPTGALSSGQCCGPPAGAPACLRPCQTLFRVCLKEYQSNVSVTGSCSFGNASTAVLAGNSFTLADPDHGDAAATLVLPFTFRWTRSFTLILQALDYVNETDPVTYNLIEEATYSGIIVPSPEWHALSHRGSVATLSYRVRVQCSANYYNATCTKFCRPRDDKFGHYKCDEKGDKACLQGWQGANCEIAVCTPGCHPNHGKCDRPGDCECRPGWRGELCDECTPYPGCKHGYCNGSSWQCICDTNWGGILCDQDLNYCGTHEPCQNGGTCENTAPDQYLCTCPDGFSGLNCQVVDNPCATQPCRNGGMCRHDARQPGGFRCECPPGWDGPTCQHNVDECLSSPCQHGATCLDLVDGFKCICSSGWQGDLCHLDADECALGVLSPCVNAVACTNMPGGYHCTCQPGWTGINCQQNINDCTGQCRHGATCIDLVNNFHCACPPGYTGRHCATDIDECSSNPCRNGGECSDRVNGYKCICPVGFTGPHCEEDHDHCTPNPCQNGASCFNTQGDDYYCHCPERWHGKNCSQPVLVGGGSSSGVVSPPVSSPDSLDPCMNSDGPVCGVHGTCLIQPHSLSGFICVCDAGFTGPFCKEDVNECGSNPCQNGATCLDQMNGFRCACPPGWHGDLCSANTNECDPNPCQNRGSCVDLIADFACRCRDGWKGRTCQLRDGHCDASTCQHGGTCVELGDSYTCQCPEGWSGTHCHLPTACSHHPCRNGATCLPHDGPDGFLCVCRPGFQGRFCQVDLDECAKSRCMNGGRCIDALNWFLCECPSGFGGPDCRLRIQSEPCASLRCTHGGTCVVTGNNSPSCVCPPGRTGLRCELLDESTVWSTGACLLSSGLYRPDGAVWSSGDACNQCQCSNGTVRCSQVWCGTENCLSPMNQSSGPGCRPNQVCVPAPGEACLHPPCASWGECRDLAPGKRVGPPLVPSPSTCWPNQAVLSARCATITLVFARPQVPRATSVESACRWLRGIAAVASLNTPKSDTRLILLCDLKQTTNTSLEVTLWTETEGSSSSADNRAVADAVRALAEMLSRKTNNDHRHLLDALLEVKVETALLATVEDKASNSAGTGYLIALVCLVLSLTVVVLGALYWHVAHRRQRAGLLTHPPGASHHHHPPHCEDEKSNNLQNEENLRRYANPLKDTVSTGSGVASSSSVGASSSGGSMASLATAVSTPSSDIVSIVSGNTGNATTDTDTALELLTDVEHHHHLHNHHHNHHHNHKNSSVSSTSTTAIGDAGGSSNGQSGAVGGSATQPPAEQMLYKPQNPDMRKNTAAPNIRKDFAKRINLSTTTGGSSGIAPVNPRTFPPEQRTVIV